MRTKRLIGLSPFLLAVFVLAGCAGTRTSVPPTPEAAPAAEEPAWPEDPSILAVYGDRVLTIDEFEQRYARATGSSEAAAADSLPAYRDFLERYLNFRLKVLAAEEAGFGRDEEVRREIQSYRVGLAQPYLLEQEVLEPIMRDLYRRQQTMIDASHILIRAASDASPEDTLAAYRRLAGLVDSLKAGADFNRLAARYSEDPSARGPEGTPGAGGRLGFFKSGRMVPAFERAAYATEVGEISSIIRTPFGYHILKVHDRQPVVPDIRIGHIMVVPQANTPEAVAEARSRIETLRERLLAGEDFAALAREHSAHFESAQRGGELGVLSFETPMPAAPEFKNAAFALEEGAYSDVIETSFGLHVIKLLDRMEIPSYEEAAEEIKQYAMRLPRTQEALRQYTTGLHKQYGLSVDSALVRATFGDLPPDSLAPVLYQKRLPEDVRDRSFAALGDSTYSFRDLLGFAAAGVPDGPDTEARVFALIGRFLDEQALAYETNVLEQRDPDFARTMEEFRDGVLLFELMEDSVWTAAAQDSAALQAYYEAHADTYRYPERTRVLTLYGPKDKLEAVAARLGEGATVEHLLAEYETRDVPAFEVDTTFVAGPTESPLDLVLEMEAGQHTPVQALQGRYAILLHGGTEAARPKTFREARPEVLTGYQQMLEDRLLERLRRHYRVRTFPERLEHAFQEEEAGASSGRQAAAG